MASPGVRFLSQFSLNIGVVILLRCSSSMLKKISDTVPPIQRSRKFKSLPNILISLEDASMDFPIRHLPGMIQQYPRRSRK